ncbi:MAG: hypothetical protein COA84_10395 [Robiginitomaculum sp.]|nr:MAG: hypothetical protein COA84_10395 [Robiginitomaculum sp.]
MKSIALIACLALLMLTGFAASTPAPATDPTLEQRVERLNAYVRSIRTISGRFVQSTANGDQQTGTFYWKRPDKLRIEYDTSPLLIVADGSNIAQIDRELETIDQIRISWTPYKFLLSRKFDLNKGADLVGLERTDTASFVTVRDKDGNLDGDFTLIFAEPNLKFLGWTWQNAFDGEVRFILTDVEEGVKLKSALFTIREEERRRGGRRR